MTRPVWMPPLPQVEGLRVGEAHAAIEAFAIEAVEAYKQIPEIRRAIAIAQAVEEYGRLDRALDDSGLSAYEWIMRRADELLAKQEEGKR